MLFEDLVLVLADVRELAPLFMRRLLVIEPANSHLLKVCVARPIALIGKDVDKLVKKVREDVSSLHVAGNEDALLHRREAVQVLVVLHIDVRWLFSDIL